MSSTALRLQPTTVPPGPRRPPRPPLRVLPGGRSPAQVARRARYRRRRLVAAVLAVGLVMLTTLLAGAAAARFAGGDPSSAAGVPSPTSAAASGAAGVAAPTVVVQPGDTLWSIAAATQPEVDVRIAVDRIVALNGGAPLQVGQELVLPG